MTLILLHHLNLIWKNVCHLYGGLYLQWHSLLLTHLMAVMVNRHAEQTAGIEFISLLYIISLLSYYYYYYCIIYTESFVPVSTRVHIL